MADQVWTNPAGPRIRVICDNDYSGDPDGLVQLAHHALSPSVDLKLVIGSHLRPGDAFDPSDQTADHGALGAQKVLELAGRSDVPVVAGSNVGLNRRDKPIPSAATRGIIAEALREDTDLPLYLCLGAGLTELASACLIEPAIIPKLTAVWIGGAEYPGLATPPPGAPAVEYNTAIDPIAAQVILNDLDVPLWQVPRDAYRQCLASMAELARNLRPAGPLGAHLFGALETVVNMAGSHGFNTGETYVLGDSPLVLLTALQSSFEPDPSSSRSLWRPTQIVNDDGSYAETQHPSRRVRVFTTLDSGLLLRDLYAKLHTWSASTT